MALISNRTVSNHWLVTVMSRRKMSRALNAVLPCVRDVFHSWLRAWVRWPARHHHEERQRARGKQV